MVDNGLSPTIQKQIADVKNNPQDAGAWQALGDLFAENGDDRRAAGSYRRVLALRPGDPVAQVSLDKLAPSGAERLSDAADELLGELESLRSLESPLWFQVFLALVSFLITLMLASAQSWKVTDLVWSLWVTSLVLGYSYLITGILSSTLRGAVAAQGPAGKFLQALFLPGNARWVLAILGGLFMLAFFSMHFLMFHFVHSIFLNLFFPIYGSAGSFPNFLALIGVCFSRYWPIILLSAATSLPAFLSVTQATDTNFVSMPYRNVLRMHFSIFVFAGLSMLRISAVGLYYLLILYYFPFGALKAFFFNRPAPASQSRSPG
jgi:hypothetical protein